MVRKLARGHLLVALLTLASPAAADQDVRFEHRFDAGSSQRYRVRIATEMDTGSGPLHQLADLQVTVKCVSGTAGSYALEMDFDKADMSRQMLGDMETDPRGEQLVGHSVTFDVTPSGRVSNIKPVGAFEGWDGLRAVIEPVVKDWFVYLPDTTVAPGGGWSREEPTEKQPTGAEVTTREHYTFKGLKKEKGRDCAVVEATVDSQLGGTSTTPVGTYNVSGTGKGKYEFLFDPAAGRVVKAKGKLDVEMNMVPANAVGDAVHTLVGYTIDREAL